MRLIFACLLAAIVVILVPHTCVGFWHTVAIISGTLVVTDWIIRGIRFLTSLRDKSELQRALEDNSKLL